MTPFKKIGSLTVLLLAILTCFAPQKALGQGPNSSEQIDSFEKLYKALNDGVSIDLKNPANAIDTYFKFVKDQKIVFTADQANRLITALVNKNYPNLSIEEVRAEYAKALMKYFEELKIKIDLSVYTKVLGKAVENFEWKLAQIFIEQGANAEEILKDRSKLTGRQFNKLNQMNKDRQKVLSEIARKESEAQLEKETVEVGLMDKLARDMASGLRFDIANPEHRFLLSMYIASNFQGSDDQVDIPKRIEDMQKVAEEHPLLFFPNHQARSADIRLVDRIYNQIPEINGIYFEISAEADQVYQQNYDGKVWSGIENPNELVAQAHRNALVVDPKIPTDLTSFLKNTATRSLLWRELGKILIERITQSPQSQQNSSYRNLLGWLSKTYAFSDPSFQAKFQGADGQKRISLLIYALRDAVREYETVELKMPEELYFSRGQSKQTNTDNQIKLIESKIPELKIKETKLREIALRPLQYYEMPFLSRLGYHCTTKESSYGQYNTRPYLAYTLTMPNGVSKGSVVLLLGTAEHKGVRQDVAMIEQIDNIDVEFIDPVLESLRRVMMLDKITLLLPENLKRGSTANLSNTAEVMDAVEGKSYYRKGQQYLSFKPVQHVKKFDHEGTRLYEKRFHGKSVGDIDIGQHEITAIRQPKQPETPPAFKEIKGDLEKMRSNLKIENKRPYFLSLKGLVDIEEFANEHLEARKLLIQFSDRNTPTSVSQAMIQYADAVDGSDSRVLKTMLEHAIQEYESNSNPKGIHELLQFATLSYKFPYQKIHNLILDNIDFFHKHRMSSDGARWLNRIAKWVDPFYSNFGNYIRSLRNDKKFENIAKWVECLLTMNRQPQVHELATALGYALEKKLELKETILQYARDHKVMSEVLYLTFSDVQKNNQSIRWVYETFKNENLAETEGSKNYYKRLVGLFDPIIVFEKKYNINASGQLIREKILPNTTENIFAGDGSPLVRDQLLKESKKYSFVDLQNFYDEIKGDTKVKWPIFKSLLEQLGSNSDLSLLEQIKLNPEILEFFQMGLYVHEHGNPADDTIEEVTEEKKSLVKEFWYQILKRFRNGATNDAKLRETMSVACSWGVKIFGKRIPGDRILKNILENVGMTTEKIIDGVKISGDPEYIRVTTDDYKQPYFQNFYDETDVEKRAVAAQKIIQDQIRINAFVSQHRSQYFGKPFFKDARADKDQINSFLRNVFGYKSSLDTFDIEKFAESNMDALSASAEARDWKKRIDAFEGLIRALQPIQDSKPELKASLEVALASQKKLIEAYNEKIRRGEPLFKQEKPYEFNEERSNSTTQNIAKEKSEAGKAVSFARLEAEPKITADQIRDIYLHNKNKPGASAVSVFELYRGNETRLFDVNKIQNFQVLHDFYIQYFNDILGPDRAFINQTLQSSKDWKFSEAQVQILRSKPAMYEEYFSDGMMKYDPAQFLKISSMMDLKNSDTLLKHLKNRMEKFISEKMYLEVVENPKALDYVILLSDERSMDEVLKEFFKHPEVLQKSEILKKPMAKIKAGKVPTTAEIDEVIKLGEYRKPARALAMLAAVKDTNLELKKDVLLSILSIKAEFPIVKIPTIEQFFLKFHEEKVSITDKELKSIASIYTEAYFEGLEKHQKRAVSESIALIQERHPEIEKATLDQVKQSWFRAHLTGKTEEKGKELVADGVKRKALVKSQDELTKLGIDKDVSAEVTRKLADSTVLVLGMRSPPTHWTYELIKQRMDALPEGKKIKTTHDWISMDKEARKAAGLPDYYTARDACERDGKHLEDLGIEVNRIIQRPFSERFKSTYNAIANYVSGTQDVDDSRAMNAAKAQAEHDMATENEQVKGIPKPEAIVTAEPPSKVENLSLETFAKEVGRWNKANPTQIIDSKETYSYFLKQAISQGIKLQEFDRLLVVCKKSGITPVRFFILERIYRDQLIPKAKFEMLVSWAKDEISLVEKTYTSDIAKSYMRNSYWMYLWFKERFQARQVNQGNLSEAIEHKDMIRVYEKAEALKTLEKDHLMVTREPLIPTTPIASIKIQEEAIRRATEIVAVRPENYERLFSTAASSENWKQMEMVLDYVNATKIKISPDLFYTPMGYAILTGPVSITKKILEYANSNGIVISTYTLEKIISLSVDKNYSNPKEVVIQHLDLIFEYANKNGITISQKALNETVAYSGKYEQWEIAEYIMRKGGEIEIGKDDRLKQTQISKLKRIKASVEAQKIVIVPMLPSNTAVPVTDYGHILRNAPQSLNWAQVNRVLNDVIQNKTKVNVEDLSSSLRWIVLQGPTETVHKIFEAVKVLDLKFSSDQINRAFKTLGYLNYPSVNETEVLIENAKILLDYAKTAQIRVEKETIEATIRSAQETGKSDSRFVEFCAAQIPKTGGGQLFSGIPIPESNSNKRPLLGNNGMMSQGLRYVRELATGTRPQPLRQPLYQVQALNLTKQEVIQWNENVSILNAESLLSQAQAVSSVFGKDTIDKIRKSQRTMIRNRDLSESEIKEMLRTAITLENYDVIRVKIGATYWVTQGVIHGSFTKMFIGTEVKDNGEKLDPSMWRDFLGNRLLDRVQVNEFQVKFEELIAKINDQVQLEQKSEALGKVKARKRIASILKIESKKVQSIVEKMELFEIKNAIDYYRLNAILGTSGNLYSKSELEFFWKNARLYYAKKAERLEGETKGTVDERVEIETAKRYAEMPVEKALSQMIITANLDVEDRAPVKQVFTVAAVPPVSATAGGSTNSQSSTGSATNPPTSQPEAKKQESTSWVDATKRFFSGANYVYILPEIQAMKSMSEMELIAALEKVPPSQVATEGARYKAAVMELDARLKILRIEGLKSKQSSYWKVIDRLTEVSKKSMGKAGWDHSQRTGIAGAGIKAMAEGGKFGIALLVSEALRVMTDPKADLEDMWTLVTHFPMEAVRLITFTGSAGAGSTFADKMMDLVYKKAGPKLEAQAAQRLLEINGSKKFVSRSMLRKLVKGQIGFMVGLMTNKLLWENGAQDPDFFKNAFISFASFGGAQVSYKMTKYGLRAIYSTAKVGTKGLRSMAIEAGPGGWFVAGVELGIEMFISTHIESWMRGKEVQTDFEKRIRIYSAMFSSEIVGSRGKNVPELCKHYAKQTEESISCIGNLLHQTINEYIQFEVFKGLYELQADAIADQEVTLKHQNVLTASFKDESYVLDTVQKPESAQRYRAYKEGLVRVKHKYENYLSARSSEYEDVLEDINPSTLQVIANTKAILEKKSGLGKDCYAKQDMYEFGQCIVLGNKTGNAYEAELSELYYQKAELNFDQTWYRRLFSSTYDGTILGLEMRGKIAIGEVIEACRGRGRSLIATTRAQSEHVSNPEQLEGIQSAVKKYLMGQMKMMVELVDEIKASANGEDLKQFEKNIYRPILAKVQVGENVLPASFMFPSTPQEQALELAQHELKMIQSKTKEISVWLPKEVKNPSSGPLDEKTSLALATYLVETTWKTMDSENFNGKYGRDLEQAESQINNMHNGLDRGDTYIRKPDINVIREFKQKQHDEDTAVQRDAFLNAKAKLIIDLSAEIQKGNYIRQVSQNELDTSGKKLQKTNFDNLCYEVQFYRESFATDQAQRITYDSQLLIHQKPILYPQSIFYIGCDRDKALRSRVLDASNNTL